MVDYSIDAIKIAKAVQRDELSILYGKELKMRDKIKKKKHMKMRKTRNKYTLNELGSNVDKLIVTVDNLAKEMRDSFKQVNNRIDRIETRLDYIVKANDLKDLSNSKNK